ncbi:transposase [Rhodococcus triatomae]
MSSGSRSRTSCRRGRSTRPPVLDAKPMVEGIVCRYRCGIAWRDVPAVFGPWQTIWTWHRRLVGDGTWDQVLECLLGRRTRPG